jgi:hypothetical protein
MIATMKQASNKTEFMKKLANFECQLVNENENEQIPHKLLSERFYVSEKHFFQINSRAKKLSI